MTDLQIDPRCFDQIVQLNPDAIKLIAAIFEAIRLLHASGSFHDGDLSVPQSYGLRIKKSFGNQEYEVHFIPGFYSTREQMVHRNSRRNNVSHQQATDTRQLQNFIFEFLLRLPSCDYFVNFRSEIDLPRLPKYFQSLKKSFNKYITKASSGHIMDEVAKGNTKEFYNHYSVRTSEFRKNHLTYLSDRGLCPNPNHTTSWKIQLKDNPSLYSFYRNPGPGQPKASDYEDSSVGHLKFMKHAFTHISEKQFAAEFNDSEYLEFVFAELFYNHYDGFFKLAD